MTANLQPENALFTLEEQYQVAAWDSTIRSLALFWADPIIHIKAEHVPAVVYSLAEIAFKDPGDIVPSIQSRADLPHNSANDLINLGMISGKDYTPTESLVLMHSLNHDTNEVYDEIAALSAFERFHRDVAELALYHHQKLRQATIDEKMLSTEIRVIQRDNAFYIGMWDNDRTLGIALAS